MGQNLQKIMNHPCPIDHRGTFTRHARRHSMLTYEEDEQNPDQDHKDKQNLKASVGLDLVQNSNDNDPKTNVNLGDVFTGILLAVFAIVSALCLQKAIDYGFELLMPSGEKMWKLLSLFLQFILVFSFLVFFAFVFAG